ncbi:hypothetical protein H1R20_g751, partial [Candolleomyces eurysporus]
MLSGRIIYDVASVLQIPRKGLTSAMQWFDCLVQAVERKTEAILQHAATLASSEATRTPECARILKTRCPSCFGGKKFGGKHDVVVSVDGNFNHRHETVDQVGEDIAAARKRPAKPRRPTGARVPDEALDVCQDSHEAGSGSNVKTSLEHFDDGGVMALVCRHDIPLFLANIDTPGEQQKYPIALIKHLFSLIPGDATVMVQYDVGCVVDRSREQFQILPEAICSRLSFSTSIMHSYAHEFACQIVYNPRAEKNVPMHEKTADEAIAKVSYTPAELMTMWEQQKQTQLSVRSHAPARIKKELEAILNLQSELESVEQSIQSTRNFVSSLRSASGITKTLLDTLEARQQDIALKVEELYASLNVHESFPELQGVDLEFVRCLLLARDIKMNIRKRAIGSFNEYDKLNQAQGGGGPPVGTKAHQYYRQSIAKRMPALRKLIRRFNDLCARAKSLYKPQWNIPVPEQLPEEISLLKKDPGLLEDVWISSAPSTTYQWLYDSEIREAMRAVHRKERCVEEKQRIGMEMDNLCRWFGTEIMAAEIALILLENTAFRAILSHYRSRIIDLKGQWSTRTTSALFDAHITAATKEAKRQYARLVGQPPDEGILLTWLKPMVTGSVRDTDPESPDDNISACMDPPTSDEEKLLMDPGNTDLGDQEDEDLRASDDDYSTDDEDTATSFHEPNTDVNDAMIVDDPIISHSILRMEYATADSMLLVRLESLVSVTDSSERTAPHLLSVALANGARRYVFSRKELHILASKDQRLNDDCVNNLAMLLHVLLCRLADVEKKATLCCVFFDVRIRTTFDRPTRKSSRPYLGSRSAPSILGKAGMDDSNSPETL